MLANFPITNTDRIRSPSLRDRGHDVKLSLFGIDGLHPADGGLALTHEFRHCHLVESRRAGDSEGGHLRYPGQVRPKSAQLPDLV